MVASKVPPSCDGDNLHRDRRSSAPPKLVLIPEDRALPSTPATNGEMDSFPMRILNGDNDASNAKDSPHKEADQVKHVSLEIDNEDSDKAYLTFYLAAGVIVSTAIGSYVGILFHPAALAVLVLGNSVCLACSELLLHSRKSFTVNPESAPREATTNELNITSFSK